MYLKSLTLRGFKSFASSTTLHFEPGITCVVGPNGSGKSNVVDAIAWVMGEQGAKSLRGGKMEDVIFAGTAGRAPLGRAEVVLTIDNTDGALPIDYAEVTISRIMFRNGGSEYSINGQTCRLLDIQELLSDSGIGREMHVIVGQGQLDTILHATPEDRRGFIEEAAGVLKHRKRKEKALRKLDATEGNLTRLQDLLSEIRRALRPLGKQAEAARKAAVIQADARDARARLLADDLVQLTTTLAQEVADENALRERRTTVERELAVVQKEEAELDEALREDAPRVARAQETWYRLSSLKERLRGTASLATERSRHLAEAREEERGGRDPDQLEADAARVREEENEIAAEIETHREALDEAVGFRQAQERAHAEEERRIATLQRAAADRREGLARLTGQVDTVRSRLETRENEIARLTAARAEAETRADTAGVEFTTLETEVVSLDAGESGLDAQHEAARSALDSVEERLTVLRQDEQEAERERVALAARKEALELGLSRKDGAAALLAATESVSGLLGSVAALLSVEPGYEAAVAGALGRAADAVAVESVDAAVGALLHLRAEDLGRSGLVLGGAAAGPEDDPHSWPGLPVGARYAVDVVSAPAEVLPALVRLLARVAVVDDLAAARALVADRPEVVAVTREGDLLGVHVGHGGSAAQPSLLEVQAAVDDASDRLRHAGERAERLRTERTEAEAERAVANQQVEVGADPPARVGRGARGRRRAAGGAGFVRAVRPGGGRAPGHRDRGGADRDVAATGPGSASSKSGSRTPRTPPTRSLRHRSATGWPRCARSAGSARWRPGSPCVRRRSGVGRCRDARTPSNARPATNAPPASGPGSAVSAAPARHRSRPLSSPPSSRYSPGSTPRSRRRDASGRRPSRPRTAREAEIQGVRQKVRDARRRTGLPHQLGPPGRDGPGRAADADRAAGAALDRGAGHRSRDARARVRSRRTRTPVAAGTTRTG